jgi:hypothetical protein
MQRIGEGSAGRVQDRSMKQARCAFRRRLAAFAVPCVEADVMVIAASGDKSSLFTVTLHQLEAEYTLIKAKGAIEVCDLEVNMADTSPGDHGFER